MLIQIVSGLYLPVEAEGGGVDLFNLKMIGLLDRQKFIGFLHQCTQSLSQSRERPDQSRHRKKQDQSGAV